MAAAVQPMPKGPSSPKGGITQTLVSFIVLLATVIMEPNITRAAGISKSPKASRFSSFLPGVGKSNLKWHQRLFTLSGWKFNIKVSTEQWKSRLTVFTSSVSRAWASLGTLRYTAAAGLVLLIVYFAYTLWNTETVQGFIHHNNGTSTAHANGAINGTVVRPKSTVAKASTFASVQLPGLLSWKKDSQKTQHAPDTHFDVDAAYSSPEQASSSIIQDIRGAGLKMVRGDIKTLLEVAFSAGKPVDDKKMTMEKVVAIAASLPPNSKARTILTNFLTEGLWKSLQHPPLSYQGEKFEYRMPDGSFNNVLFPDLGKAGTPYARTVRRLRKLDGVRPDPGLLFDTLMGRSPGKFKENPAGLSSVLFYHASIIIHDIFRTNRLDPNISDTSSYLDLAPLYGSSLDDQLKIRTMERGLLKPDTFHEKRLLGQPPGVNIMLVMYNRFHNYVADMLLKINEGGRFTLPPARNEQEKKAVLAKQDNDLFQTARLIVGGLYINISLHDYLRGLTNTHHTSSSWTIDPRVEIKKANGEEVARGVGNQISAEFNLLYRFHSIISQRDEKWLNDFLASLFPGTKKKLDELTPQELLQGLLRWEQNIHPDPSKRTFDGLKRGADGKFKDEDLVRIMTNAMESPAGVFGPRMVPKALRVVETLGILQARKWRMASLNEFRSFFGLKKYETMEDINPDPEIANILRHLYDSPDMVELYPGLFIEETKPPMSPGNGGCLGFTAGRAVFSDAITLVRSDRFYTIDYTPSTLTNWGMQEVQQDYNIMGGSMFYKLFQRALPGWYPYNSLHIMQPMYTWKKNKEIAEELGTISQFTLAPPKPPPSPVILTKHATICKVLKDQTAFRVPWLAALNDLFPGKKDYSDFMLGGDAAQNTAQRQLLMGIIYGPTDFAKLLRETVKSTASALLKSQTFELPGAASQINVLKDIAIPVNTIIQADLFSLDLRGPENPNGSLSIPELYKYLVDVRTWGFNNSDPAMAFRRRLWAQQGAKVLTETTISAVSHLAGGAKGISSRLMNLVKKSPTAHAREGSLRWYGQHVAKELLNNGKTVEEAADIMWLTALAGVSVPVGLFADVLQFFLQPQNSEHWAKIQEIVSQAGPTCEKLLRQYVLEAQRMTSRQRNLRICAQDCSIDGHNFKRGEAVICLLGQAGHDTSCVPDPHVFKPGRPAEAYIHFGHGPHECLGREMSLTYCVGLLEVVAGLKHLRPAPGAMGELKCIQVGTEKCYLDDTWSWLTFDPTTWKLHFDGVGKGVCRGHSVFDPVSAGQDMNAIYDGLQLQNVKGPRSVNIAGSQQVDEHTHLREPNDQSTEGQAPAPQDTHVDTRGRPHGGPQSDGSQSGGNAGFIPVIPLPKSSVPDHHATAQGAASSSIPTPLHDQEATNAQAGTDIVASGNPPISSNTGRVQPIVQVPKADSATSSRQPEQLRGAATGALPSSSGLAAPVPATPDSALNAPAPDTVPSSTPKIAPTPASTDPPAATQNVPPPLTPGSVSGTNDRTPKASEASGGKSGQPTAHVTPKGFEFGIAGGGMQATTIFHRIGTTVEILDHGVPIPQSDNEGTRNWFVSNESQATLDVQKPQSVSEPHRIEATKSSESTTSTSRIIQAQDTVDSFEIPLASHEIFFPLESQRDAKIKMPEELLPPPLPEHANGGIMIGNGTAKPPLGKADPSGLSQVGTFSTTEQYSYPQHMSESSKMQNFTHSFTSDAGRFISIRALELDRSSAHSVNAKLGHATGKDVTVNVEASKNTKLYRCDVDWMFSHENGLELGFWSTGDAQSKLITTQTVPIKFDRPMEGIKGILVALDGFDAEGTSGGATSLDIAVKVTSSDKTGCTIEVKAGPGCKLHRAKGYWLAYTQSNGIVTGDFTSAGKQYEAPVKFDDRVHKFDTPPKVIAGLRKVQFDISKGDAKCVLSATDITKEGFKWGWETSAESMVGVCEGVYIALDQKLLAPH